MQKMKYSNKAIGIFFTSVIILSIAAEAFICADGAEWMYAVLMWIPAFSAIMAIVFQTCNQKGKKSSFTVEFPFLSCQAQNLDFMRSDIYFYSSK